MCEDRNAWLHVVQFIPGRCNSLIHPADNLLQTTRTTRVRRAFDPRAITLPTSYVTVLQDTPWSWHCPKLALPCVRPFLYPIFQIFFGFIALSLRTDAPGLPMRNHVPQRSADWRVRPIGFRDRTRKLLRGKPIQFQSWTHLSTRVALLELLLLDPLIILSIMSSLGWI